MEASCIKSVKLPPPPPPLEVTFKKFGHESTKRISGFRRQPLSGFGQGLRPVDLADSSSSAFHLLSEVTIVDDRHRCGFSLGERRQSLGGV